MSGLSIIIVSYNTKELTIQAVRSVLGAGEIIVVDNHSTDGSVTALKTEFGSRIQIVTREDNGGFAKANNAGIKIARGSHILLLNSDTIVKDTALDHLVSAMNAHPKFAILAARLQNEDGTYQPQGGALPTLLNVAAWWLWPIPGTFPFINPYQNPRDPSLGRQSPVAVGWVGGTAMLIQKKVLDTIGLLDENIFMYAEDVDLCLRAKKQGYLVGIVPQANIIHLGSKSAGSHNALIGEVRGLLYLWKKYFPAWQLPLLRIIFLKGALLRYLLFGILLGKKEARGLYRRVIHETLK